MFTDHEKKYEKYAKKIGIKSLTGLIPESPGRIRVAMAQDEHLNNIPLKLWDRHDHWVRTLAHNAGVEESGGWSLANTVCLLKHVAKYHYAK